MRLFCLALMLVLSCLTGAEARTSKPKTIYGFATVHDGDTIRISTNGQSYAIRIWGIDAVELKQTCTTKDGLAFACGIQARDTLERIVSGKMLSCTVKGRSYKRLVATCMADGADIASSMTREGMAFDYSHYSHAYYSADEAAAKQAGAGIWSATFEPPALWRACHLRPTDRRPKNCA